MDRESSTPRWLLEAMARFRLLFGTGWPEADLARAAAELLAIGQPFDATQLRRAMDRCEELAGDGRRITLASLKVVLRAQLGPSRGPWSDAHVTPPSHRIEDPGGKPLDPVQSAERAREMVERLRGKLSGSAG